MPGAKYKIEHEDQSYVQKKQNGVQDTKCENGSRCTAYASLSRDLASLIGDQFSTFWDIGNQKDNGTCTKPGHIHDIHVRQKELLVQKVETSSSSLLFVI